MDVAPRVELRQKLSLTPEMRQRLQVLGMSAVELKDRVEQEVLENPTLELEEFEPEHEERTEEDLGLSDEEARALAEWDRDLATHEEGADWSVPGEEAERPSAVDIAHKGETFEESLIGQLGEVQLSDEAARAARAIILSLDEDGYFRGELDEVAEQSGVSRSEAIAGLSAVQALEPSGVGARDLTECLLIQLRDQGQSSGLAVTIVRDHLADLAAGKAGAIARALHVTPRAVAEAAELVRSLNPRPANAYSAGVDHQYVVPEFMVRIVGGELMVLPIAEASQTIRVSPLYASMVRSGTGDPKALEYLRERVRAARRFVKDVERRRETLAAVAEAAVSAQADYFLRPEGELVPLRLEQVATELGLHPSTISRAVNGKYVDTPRGVVELRKLFSGGLPSGEGSIAVASVKRRIRELIGAEPPDAPFSDARLTELLRAQGVDISRRTVAKYREQMNVAGSWKRRRA